MPGFIVRAVPPSETGSAMGFYQVLRSIGLSVGSALAAACSSPTPARAPPSRPSRGSRRSLCLGLRAVRGDRRAQLRPPGPTRIDEPSAAVEHLMEEEAEVGGAGLMLAEDPRVASRPAQG